MIDDLIVRPDTIKCQEENIRGKVLTLALAMIFRFDTKSKCNESKNSDVVELHQTNKLLLSKRKHQQNGKAS